MSKKDRFLIYLKRHIERMLESGTLTLGKNDDIKRYDEITYKIIDGDIYIEIVYTDTNFAGQNMIRLRVYVPKNSSSMFRDFKLRKIKKIVGNDRKI